MARLVHLVSGVVVDVADEKAGRLDGFAPQEQPVKKATPRRVRKSEK